VCEGLTHGAEVNEKKSEEKKQKTKKNKKKSPELGS
jgi:hypothetical protein